MNIPDFKQEMHTQTKKTYEYNGFSFFFFEDTCCFSIIDTKYLGSFSIVGHEANITDFVLSNFEDFMQENDLSYYDVGYLQGKMAGVKQGEKETLIKINESRNRVHKISKSNTKLKSKFPKIM